MVDIEIKTEFLFEVKIPQKPLHRIGETPSGYRLITTPDKGATVIGPKLCGTVLEGGGDPYLLRKDGVGLVDARITIQADDGDLIGMSYLITKLSGGSARGPRPKRYPRLLFLRRRAVRDRFGEVSVDERDLCDCQGVPSPRFVGRGIGYKVYKIL